MRLAEIDGKPCCAAMGLAVPRGLLLQGDPPAEAAQWGGHILKAQVLEERRGKRGLVRRLAGLHELAETQKAIAAALGDGGAPLLLEEALAIAREIYVAVRIDGTRQTLELLVAGGEDVEQTDALARILGRGRNDPRRSLSAAREAVSPDLAARLARYCARLPEIARREDLSFSRSTRSCSRRTGASSPATPRSFATTARTHAMTRWNSRSAARWPSAP